MNITAQHLEGQPGQLKVCLIIIMSDAIQLTDKTCFFSVYPNYSCVRAADCESL